MTTGMLSGPRGCGFGARVLAVAALGLMSQALCAAALDPAIEQHIRQATFEVVQHKPPDGEVQYQRALPMDLIPFQQRNDAYRSIGTAFAIGPNRYVTASHVLLAGLGSEFGPPALRDAAGHVYAIDQVLKFSDHEDYALFSLRSEPPGVIPLAIGAHPEDNATVYAVGNALGEGIVIRDGLHTSDTPEEMNGEWKWLRFSAAASPGNSGGPLVDVQGRVIGVVLRKSAAENLNYALPISRVQDDPDDVGRLEGHSSIHLPVLPDASATLTINERFSLPMDLPTLYATVERLSEQRLEQAWSQAEADNAARLFPNGEGADQLLHAEIDSPLPRLMRARQDGIWQIVGTTPPELQLDANGFLRIGNGMVRLRAPDNIALRALYSDSKLLMDLVLRGYPLQRNVGGQQIRIVSLGHARELGTWTDAWGRVWQARSWPVPYADMALSALCLPTPEGMDLMLLPVPARFQQQTLKLQEHLTDYVYLTLQGSLARWQEYLAIPGILPHPLAGLQLSIDPTHSVQIVSHRFSLHVDPQLVKLSADSVLALQTAYFRDAGRVVWDVAGVVVQEATGRRNWVRIARASAPESTLPEAQQANWLKLQGRQFPFDGTVSSNQGISRVYTVADGTPADGRVQYVLAVVGEGVLSQPTMTAQLSELRHDFRVLEH